MKKDCRGFELVEIMIIVVIIGLICATAIPAFQKVKYASIDKAIKRGETVSAESKRWYLAQKKHQDSSETEKAVLQKKPVQGEDSLQRIVIDGQKYIVIPKSEVKEISISSKQFWLVPVTE